MINPTLTCETKHKLPQDNRLIDGGIVKFYVTQKAL